MSVLVKNMEMPQNCTGCPICCGLPYQHRDVKGRRPDCPLIELPPHGRLIDVDKIEYEKLYIDDVGKSYEMVGKDDIDELPTVIEAEGETE